jgi:putative membrane protein
MRPAIKGLLAAFALSSMFGAASAQQADQTNFLADAIRGGVAEVKLGQLAAERAQSLQVRQYGEMLRKDHTQSLQKASGLANEIGVPASSELSARQQKQFESLQKLSGEEFDTTFLSQMVRDHQENIAKFSAEAQNGSNPEVMAFAKETLPTLQAHLEHAQSVQSDLAAAAHRAHSGESSSDDAPSPPLKSQVPVGQAAPSRNSGASDHR